MNKLLEGQLRQQFGKTGGMPENLGKLLNVISGCYDDYETEKRVAARPIEPGYREMKEKNALLIKEVEALKKQHTDLKALFENFDQVLYSADMVSETLTSLSVVCEKVYGYTATEFFSDKNLWQKIIHPDDKYVAEEHTRLLYQGNQVINQYRIIHKDESIRWIENKIIPTLDNTGRLVRIDGVTSDISAFKHTEKKLEKAFSILEATIESTADGILVADFNGKITRFNKKFVELWAIPKSILDEQDNDKAIAVVLDQLINPEEFISKIKELCIRQIDVSFDILKFKDGRILERYSQPQLINGNCVGRVWSFRDITERTKAAEATLLLSDMISNTGDAIIISDPFTDKIIFWNEGAERLYGYKKAEAIGIAKQELFQTRFPISFDFINDLFHKNGSWNGELIYTNKNGNSVNVETSWTLRRNESGVAIGILEINRDITEKKNAGTALISRDRQLTIAAQIAKLGYWELDLLKGMFTFNDQFYSIFKTTAEEMGGYTMVPERYAELFVHPDDKDVIAMEVSIAINSPDPHFSRQIEHRIRYADGEIGYISVHFYIVKDEQGKTIKTFGVNQDITDRKKGEETLMRSEANLELKNKELKIKNKELEQFAYVASHDLQEPLRTILGFVELLQQQYHGKLDTKADKYLEYISNGSGRMSILIKDLLDFYRIGVNVEIKRIDCNTVVKNMLADINAAIEESKADIQSTDLPVIFGYPTEIKLLFQNLVVNAIKFQRTGVIPQIKIAARKTAGHWEFAISDNGIGIEERHHERVFNIFQRLHTRTEYAGSGIGLSHCRKIVELHNGKIWIESIAGKGSTFYFTLQINNNLHTSQVNLTYKTTV